MPRRVRAVSVRYLFPQHDVANDNDADDDDGDGARGATAAAALADNDY